MRPSSWCSAAKSTSAVRSETIAARLPLFFLIVSVAPRERKINRRSWFRFPSSQNVFCVGSDTGMEIPYLNNVGTSVAGHGHTSQARDSLSGRPIQCIPYTATYKMASVAAAWSGRG